MAENTAHPFPSISPDFFELLERQGRKSAELLAILEQELLALTAMDLQQLVTLSRKKELQVARLQKLDDAFQQLGSSLLPSKGAAPVTLSRLAQAATGEDRQRLLALRTALLGKRQEILERNRYNKKLAADVQGYLQDAIGLITNGAVGRSSYSTKGKSAGTKGPVLISREI